MTVKRYEVDLDLGKGRTMRTTLKLNDVDAKAMGLLKEKKPTEAEAKKATPANKARGAQSKRS